MAKNSLRGRALKALSLFIGFYAMALLIAAGLVVLPFLLGTFANLSYLTIRLAIFCLPAAAIILWSIMPRRAKFVRPGPIIDKDREPRLHARIAAIAGAAGQPPPQEVYLLVDPNAWVDRRGGFLGIGSRRIMGVGLPLLSILTVSQIESVLAHEFGHYRGGDVTLGPWIYRTRKLMIRTIQGLRTHGFVQAPFAWYTRAFLRITAAISRRQEVAADELAAEIAGKGAARTALEILPMIQMIAGTFWQSDIEPVLGRGYWPPYAEGLQMHLEPFRRWQAGAGAMPARPEEKTTPYDSHPTIKERLEAIDRMGMVPRSSDEAPALTLLDSGTKDLDRGFAAWAGSDLPLHLRPISWKEAGERVWPEVWRHRALSYICDMARPVPMTEVPGLLRKGMGKNADGEAFRYHLALIRMLGAAVSDALIKLGWSASVLPGTEAVLKKDGREFRPFMLLMGMAYGQKDPSEWNEECRKAGVAEVLFGPGL